MNEASTIQRLESRLARIEKMVKSICQEKREIWVGADDIMKATGWNKDEMYRMRKTGAIIFKKMGKSILYEINSVPSIFIRHENTMPGRVGSSMDHAGLNSNNEA